MYRLSYQSQQFDRSYYQYNNYQISFFTIDNMIIKHIKKYINYIKMNMLIEMNIRLFLYKKTPKSIISHRFSK